MKLSDATIFAEQLYDVRRLFTSAPNISEDMTRSWCNQQFPSLDAACEYHHHSFEKPYPTPVPGLQRNLTSLCLVFQRNR